MRNPDTLEGRPPLHEPESGFGLRLEDLGGVSSWSRKNMLGEERSRQIRYESIAVFRAEGYMIEEESGETYIAERVDGAGKRLTMNDILPLSGLGGATEIEIIVRARELPEHEVDVIEGQLPEPLWVQRS